MRDEEAIAETELGERFSFLTVEQVIDLHEDGIRRYSPTEPRALRAAGLLDSAVMTPQRTFGGEYLYETLLEMATAYLTGLAFNHPLENDNKRVAFSACSTFLRMNGYRLTLTQDEAVNLTFRVIKHELTRENVVELLEGAVEPL